VGNGGEAASWVSEISGECAPGPQGRTLLRSVASDQHKRPEAGTPQVPHPQGTHQGVGLAWAAVGLAAARTPLV